MDLREGPVSEPRWWLTIPALFARAEEVLNRPGAQRMRLADRGVLKQGMWADVVVFDPDTIRDVATFENPNQLSIGMQYVLVNGVLVIADGKMTNALPRRVLRGAGHRSATLN